MIKWVMIKNNLLPIEYDCLFFLKDGSIHIGRLENSINVVAYSVVNRPDWFDHSHNGKVYGQPIKLRL